MSSDPSINNPLADAHDPEVHPAEAGHDDPAAKLARDQELEAARRRICNILALSVLALSFLILLFNRLIFWLYHPLFVWTDQSVYLEIAQLILQGKIPYLDVFDFNPPLIMYLNVIPVLVSKALHVPAPLGLSLTIIFLSAFSCASAAWLAFKNRMVCSPIVLFSLIFFFCPLPTQGLDTDMGQREHIFMLLYLPFLIGRGADLDGGRN